MGNRTVLNDIFLIMNAIIGANYKSTATLITAFASTINLHQVYSFFIKTLQDIFKTQLYSALLVENSRQSGN